MSILIGADVVPTESNEHLFRSGDVNTLVGDELISMLLEAKYRIANLETPLSLTTNPIKKCGPTLNASPECIAGLKALGVDLFTLANNHILDQGVEGLISTINTLDTNGISYVGVGDRDGSGTPFYFNLGNITVGVYACVEHEFSVVNENRIGANPFDIIHNYRQIKSMIEHCDFIIVLYHGGKEFYRYPSPKLQTNCRLFIDAGADLVICQHSHCLGCEERYGHGTIIYGQGNFIFDHGNNEYWNSSVLVKISSNFEISYVPIKKVNNVVRLANESEAKLIMEGFFNRSEQIKDSRFIKDQYEAFAVNYISMYLSRALGKTRRSFIFKLKNKLCKGKSVELNYSESDRLAIINMIECEAHRELLLTGLKQTIDEL